jgi:hypothetical protein
MTATNQLDDKLAADLAAVVLQLRKLVLPDATHLDSRISEAAARGNPAPVLMSLLSSKDFRRTFPQLFSGIGMDYATPEIEYAVDPANLVVLFDHVAREWEKLGRDQPAWSVLSVDAYKSDDPSKIGAAFYKTGISEARRLLNSLQRHGIEPPFEKAVEYGCGLGRISIPLAQHCRQLYAYDISAPHLHLAKAYAERAGAQNIQFERVVRPDQGIEQGYDLYYSALVYQHNPPPLIFRLVNQALEGLAPRGVAVFQLPVFRKHYQFRLQEYLAAEKSGIEMHALPQRTVLDLIEENNCRVLEIFDSSRNLRHSLISNIFIVQKRSD